MLTSFITNNNSPIHNNNNNNNKINSCLQPPNQQSSPIDTKFINKENNLINKNISKFYNNNSTSTKCSTQTEMTTQNNKNGILKPSKQHFILPQTSSSTSLILQRNKSAHCIGSSSSSSSSTSSSSSNNNETASNASSSAASPPISTSSSMASSMAVSTSVAQLRNKILEKFSSSSRESSPKNGNNTSISKPYLNCSSSQGYQSDNGCWHTGSSNDETSGNGNSPVSHNNENESECVLSMKSAKYLPSKIQTNKKDKSTN
jgi:hypothetical protein